jgi:uncharacterized protein YbjT (DUF2867 family)
MQAQDKMDWVIIRPAGLLNDPMTGKGFLTEEPGVCGAIAREDVAELIAKVLFSDKADGKVLSAVDTDRITTDVAYEPLAI